MEVAADPLTLFQERTRVPGAEFAPGTFLGQ
jgi:hypothetical protein